MNDQRVRTHPQTAMQLAFNRAVQKFATSGRKPVAPPPTPQRPEKK